MNRFSFLSKSTRALRTLVRSAHSAKANKILADIFEKGTYVVQVGANDGKSSDPINAFLKRSPQCSGLLIEPIPFYFQLLMDEYKDELHRLKLINACISSSFGEREFFYIPPDIADQMDGDGPKNRWAHGQGSFSRDTIVHWIHENKFRGDRYIASLDFFIRSIKMEKIHTYPLAHIFDQHSVKHVDLLVIDVQGHENEVLKSIDFSKVSPTFIYYEDDLEENSEIINFLCGNGYKFICDDGTNKIFSIKN